LGDLPVRLGEGIVEGGEGGGVEEKGGCPVHMAGRSEVVSV